MDPTYLRRVIVDYLSAGLVMVSRRLMRLLMRLLITSVQRRRRAVKMLSRARSRRGRSMCMLRGNRKGRDLNTLRPASLGIAIALRRSYRYIGVVVLSAIDLMLHWRWHRRRRK